MKIEEIQKVAIIGAGAMGHGIAQVCAVAGLKTIITDVKQEFLDNGVGKIGEGLDFFVSKGKMTAEEKEKIMTQTLQTTLDAEEAVSDAQLIIEAVPEILDLKRTVLGNVSKAAADDAIIVTNTSTMSLSDMVDALTNPARFAGFHFFNPVPKMKLVEIIKGEHTSTETMSHLSAIVKKIKKVPVEVLIDAPGFIVNRINAPNQALLNAILDEGKIPPDQIDTTMKRMGLPMGPYELADFVGLDVFCHTLEYYTEKLSSDYKPGKKLTQLLGDNLLGMKSGQGIYQWEGEKALIDNSTPSTDIGAKEFMAIQVNEAIRVYKEKIARSTKDIDQAVMHGMRAFAGPFALAAGMKPQDLSDALENLKERFNLNILTPEPELVDGSYKQFSSHE